MFNFFSLTLMKSYIFSKKSQFTFYLFATSYILLQSSAYNLWKKVQIYQLSFYNYHLVYILATVWDSFQQREAYLCSNSITWNQPRNVSPFRYQLYQTQVLALSYHTAGDWKPQRCKCSKVKLKNSFIVRSFLFLFIHNMALLLEIVTITTGVEVENP